MLRSAISSCRTGQRHFGFLTSTNTRIGTSISQTRSLRFCIPTRAFSCTRISRADATASSTSGAKTQDSSTSSTSTTDEVSLYQGPLTATFRRLKVFSLASFTLSCTLAPFIFVIESNLPMFARAALALTAVSTSGVSTGLVAWVARPYVTTLRRLEPAIQGGMQGLEMTTMTLALSPRITRVYDPDFLVETQRPFAKWELAKEVALPTGDGTQLPAAGKEETIAETFDSNGKLTGSWIVRWGPNGEGDCREVGKVERHFNVHLELLR